MSLSLITREQREDGITILTLNRPPVNAIGAALRCALAASLSDAIGRKDVVAIVLTGAGQHFSAGGRARAPQGAGRR